MSMLANQALDSDGVDSYTIQIVSGRYVITISKGGQVGTAIATTEDAAYAGATANLN